MEQLSRARDVSSHRINKPQGQEWGNCPELVTSRLIELSNRRDKSGATVQTSQRLVSSNYQIAGPRVAQLFTARDVSYHGITKPEGQEWRNCPELVSSRLIELSNRKAKSGDLSRARDVSSHRITKLQGQEWATVQNL